MICAADVAISRGANRSASGRPTPNGAAIGTRPAAVVYPEAEPVTVRE